MERHITPHNLIRRIGPALLLGIAILVALEWGLPAAGIPVYLLPPPSRVVAAALQPEVRLAYHTLATANAALIGLAIGAFMAFMLAIAFLFLRPLEDALYPWVLLGQSLPSVALAPLLTIWLGSGLAPRAAMAALFASFPLLIAAISGLRRPAPEQLAMMQAYGASQWQIFRLLRLPAALPFIFSGLRVAGALAVIGALVSELSGAGQGLGYLITTSTYRLATDRAFAAVAAAAGLALALHGCFLWLERIVVYWERDR
ncbi:ABC transporter permease [Chloroflexus sp.]|uniref:ABC transporter permease n=1 Tax=Chloroflexus sp. TaxID=1904827 RepID=UPI00262F9529|nr:ABC transporter permease [uncultured Chloroflexus sp.]